MLVVVVWMVGAGNSVGTRQRRFLPLPRYIFTDMKTSALVRISRLTLFEKPIRAEDKSKTFYGSSLLSTCFTKV